MPRRRLARMLALPCWERLNWTLAIPCCSRFRLPRRDINGLPQTVFLQAAHTELQQSAIGHSVLDIGYSSVYLSRQDLQDRT